MSEVQETLVISEPAKIRVIADPLRQAILQEFGSPATTKEVAGRLGMPVTKLYHRVEELVLHGFLMIVDSVQRRGAVERVLQVAARRFVISVGDSGQASGLLTEGGSEWGLRASVRLHPDDFGKLEAELTRLLRDLKRDDGELYTFSVSVGVSMSLAVEN